MLSAAPVLKTIGLSKRYGKRLALAGLDLEVPPGRVFGFLGPNGAGKTTAISLILGLISPTAGRVELFGRDTGPHLAESLKRVGAVLEGVSFYPHLSARDNLRVCAAISGGVGAERIEEILGIVGLSGRAKDKVRGYSMGMRQRLALAAALLHDPELLVLDEPTNGLDPAGMREFRDTIRGIGSGGKTVFVSSHLLGEVEQMCDEVAIVKEGRVIASGTVADLVRKTDALDMRVTDTAAAKEALSTLPWPVVETNGDRLTVEAPRDSAAEISRALAEKQVYLYELRPRETSLEEIFLELTSEDAAI
jgi:ABC-2 type transport system ATP-binding protein